MSDDASKKAAPADDAICLNAGPHGLGVCGNCRFWCVGDANQQAIYHKQGLPEEKRIGQCRRYPPHVVGGLVPQETGIQLGGAQRVMIAVHAEIKYATVLDDEGACGEFQQAAVRKMVFPRDITQTPSPVKAEKVSRILVPGLAGRM